MSGCGARTAAGSLEAVFESSDVERFGWILMACCSRRGGRAPQPPNRVFSPQNWIKTKGCLAGINGAIRNYFNMLPMMPGGAEIKKTLIGATQLRPEDFEYRWSAD